MHPCQTRGEGKRREMGMRADRAFRDRETSPAIHLPRERVAVHPLCRVSLAHRFFGGPDAARAAPMNEYIVRSGTRS